MSEKPVEYKGYRIWRNYKLVDKSNPISGHQWLETVYLKTFYIAGPGSWLSETYGTIKSAKEQIDFLHKFETGGFA